MASLSPIPSTSFMSAGSMSANPTAGHTLCHCKKPAYRWQAKKQGPTLGRHFFKCQSRVCDYFLWDPMEQAAEKEKLDQEQLDVEMEEMEKFQPEM